MTRAPGASRARAALAVSAVLVLSGCAQERPDERLPREFTSSTTTTSQTTEQAAEQRAKVRVYEYASGRNTILGSPRDYRDTSTIGFAEGQVATAIVVEAAELERKRQRRSGAESITEDPRVLGSDLDPKTKGGAEVTPYVDLRACLDESGTHLVNAAGKKVKKSSGPGPRPVHFHVTNRSPTSATTWRIAWIKELKEAC